MTNYCAFVITLPMEPRIYKKLSTIQTITRLFVTLLLAWGLTACKPAPDQAKLTQIKQDGVLKVGILFNPTSYYVDQDGPTGFEYDLIRSFSDYMEVELELIPSYHVAELLDKLEAGQVDMLVGGLTVTESRSDKFRYAPPYQYVSQKLVYKQGRERPTNFDQVNAPITVAAATSHHETIEKIKADYPELQIIVSDQADPNELLELLMEGSVDFTIADSHNLSIVRRYYPDISVAFTIEEREPLSWLLQKNNDDSLYALLIDFFGNLHLSGELTALEDRYFGHVEKFNYVDTRLFMKAVDEVLPTYKEWFEQYAGDLDWRLVAAQSYQESHWDPRAKSPTGVRGIMMLTQPTAKQMGVKSRLDAESNIRGGAKYLQRLLNRIPARISEHDRPWFALAAYNLGWGHVQDGRRLTKQKGGNPDKWVDVKKYLPLLRQKRYYKNTRYGFARGDEAVTYVSNIRRYYDTLIWIDEKSEQQQKLEEKKEQVNQTEEQLAL